MNKFYIEFLEGYNRTSNIPNTLFGLKDGDSQASYYRGKKSSYRSKFVNGYMICFLPRQISRSPFLASIPMSTSPCAELQASRHKPLPLRGLPCKRGRRILQTPGLRRGSSSICLSRRVRCPAQRRPRLTRSRSRTPAAGLALSAASGRPNGCVQRARTIASVALGP